MKKSFTSVEVSAIEDNAYDLGIVIGARAERERIVMMLQEFADRNMDANVLEAIKLIKEN